MAKILVVEDDIPLQEVYVELLKGEGYEVDTADDGEVALSKMQQGGWDLVLLDIILPKINGLDVMTKIRNNPPANPNKAVVFLTNLDKSEEIERGLKLANGYLIKSQVTPGDLVRKIRAYLPYDQTPQIHSPQKSDDSFG